MNEQLINLIIDIFGVIFLNCWVIILVLPLYGQINIYDRDYFISMLKHKYKNTNSLIQFIIIALILYFIYGYKIFFERVLFKKM
jgi:hypothetical protein